MRYFVTDFVNYTLQVQAMIVTGSFYYHFQTKSKTNILTLLWYVTTSHSLIIVLALPNKHSLFHTKFSNIDQVV